MVRLDKIFTKSGDQGMTSLGDGKRTPKSDLLIHAIGAVDEANAAIGVARLTTSGAADAALRRIQNDLFDLGADLSVPPSPGDGESDSESDEKLRIVESQISRLEQEIENFNISLKPLESFILPGGVPGAAHLHLARTITRRAERQIATLMQSQDINPLILVYLNRLSDHLFILARVLNHKGEGDELWRPAGYR